MAAPAGSLTLRPMTGPDIAPATVLSREQAWPHREEDWALFLEAGEGIVAERAGRVLGTVMAWRYGKTSRPSARRSGAARTRAPARRM
jgi:hypothetical protein